MQIPEIPTDNLYKFLAISGLVTIGLGFTLPYIAIRDAQRESIAVNGRLAKLNLETEQIASRAEKANAFIDTVAGAERDSPLWEAQLELLLEQRDELLERDERLYKSRLALAEVETDKQLLTLLIEDVNLVKSIQFAAVALGCVMAGLGFAGWYFRGQRFQDAVVRQAATGKASYDEDRSDVHPAEDRVPGSAKAVPKDDRQ